MISVRNFEIHYDFRKKLYQKVREKGGERTKKTFGWTVRTFISCEKLEFYPFPRPTFWYSSRGNINIIYFLFNMFQTWNLICLERRSNLSICILSPPIKWGYMSVITCLFKKNGFSRCILYRHNAAICWSENLFFWNKSL